MPSSWPCRHSRCASAWPRGTHVYDSIRESRDANSLVQICQIAGLDEASRRRQVGRTSSLQSPVDLVGRRVRHSRIRYSKPGSSTVTTGGDKNPKVFHNDGFRNGSHGRAAAPAAAMAPRDADRHPLGPDRCRGAQDRPVDRLEPQGLHQRPAVHRDRLEHFGDADTVTPTSPTADYVFGDVEWTGWVAERGDHPSDCDRNDNANDGKEITDLGTSPPTARSSPATSLPGRSRTARSTRTGSLRPAQGQSGG